MLLNAPGSSKEEVAPAGRDFRGSSASVFAVHGNAPIHSSPMPAIPGLAAFVIQRA